MAIKLLGRNLSTFCAVVVVFQLHNLMIHYISGCASSQQLSNCAEHTLSSLLVSVAYDRFGRYYYQKVLYYRFSEAMHVAGV